MKVSAGGLRVSSLRIGREEGVAGQLLLPWLRLHPLLTMMTGPAAGVAGAARRGARESVG